MAWFETELGLPEFVRSVKAFTTEEEYALLLRWASRREPHFSAAEVERTEGRAEVLAALLHRWEPIGARVPGRSGAGPVEEDLG